MRVQFEVELLDQPARFGRDLSAIIDRCSTGQHRWVIDDLDTVLNSAWMIGRATWDVTDELAEKVFQAQILEPKQNHAQKLLIVTLDEASAAKSTETTKHEPVARARKILEQAVQLILENGTADWHFVCAMSRTYPLPALQQAIREQWLIPAHAGGKGEFRKRFEQLVDLGAPPWRIAVLMDSDRLAPGALPKDNEDKKKRLEELGAKVFVLFKREAENYLPPSLLGGARHQELLAWLLSRPPAQRDYFDMKKGAGRDANSQEATPVGGFGPAIGDRFKDAQISREEMDEVCSTSPDEIEGILRALEEML